MRLHLFVLAYNLGNFLQQLVLPQEVRRWTLTTTREKLIKIGAKVVRHARRVTFQLAEVAVTRRLFQAIRCAIDRLRLPITAPGSSRSFNRTIQSQTLWEQCPLLPAFVPFCSSASPYGCQLCDDGFCPSR